MIVLQIFWLALLHCACADNRPDPDCSGLFGTCTQRDKDILGYRAIKTIHESMDDDHDGNVELKETNGYIQEELQSKSGSERQEKFHAHDSMITVDELWKSWKSSDVYKWSLDDFVYWLVDQVKLPQYIENFKENNIDGQFMPRLAINDNNYLSNVMQIKDARHRNRIMLKATNAILFGEPKRVNSFVKDLLMIIALVVSLMGCLYAFSKHRKSQDEIKKMMIEFNKIENDENSLLSFKNPCESKINKDETSDTNQLMNDLNAAKVEAECLKLARENSLEQITRLKFAEKELETVRNALKQTEMRINCIKYEPPAILVQLLNKTYDSEKELLKFKFELIDQERRSCLEGLNKIFKRQSGLMGALKIAHSTALDEINGKLELLKCSVQKCSAEKQEWTKRWTTIDEIIGKNFQISNVEASDMMAHGNKTPKPINSHQTNEFELKSSKSYVMTTPVLPQRVVYETTDGTGGKTRKTSPSKPHGPLTDSHDFSNIYKTPCTLNGSNQDLRLKTIGSMQSENDNNVHNSIEQKISISLEPSQVIDQYGSPTSLTADTTPNDASANPKRTSKSHLYQFKKILPFIKISKKIKQK